MQTELWCSACNGVKTLGEELLYFSLNGETSGAGTPAMRRKTCFIRALSRGTFCLWDILTRDCGFSPPRIPHVLLGSVAIHFAGGPTPSAISPWLMGKGNSWGCAEGKGLSPTSLSTWLSALVLCALSGNKSVYLQGKSGGDAIFQSRAKGLEMWQYCCSNGKSGTHYQKKSCLVSLTNTKLSMVILIFVGKAVPSEKKGGRSWNSTLAMMISEDRILTK